MTDRCGPPASVHPGGCPGLEDVVGYKDYLRSDAVDLELDEVLRSAPTVLLGVGPDAARALAPIHR